MASQNEELALLEQLQNHPSLIKNLGISDETISEFKKRKRPDKVSLALNLKKIKLPNTKSSDLNTGPDARSPVLKGPAPGASKVGAGNSSGPVIDNNNNNTESDSGDSVDEPGDDDKHSSNSGGDDLRALEEDLLAEDDQSLNEVSDEGSIEDDPLGILGGSPDANWCPEKKFLEWYLKVADIELDKKNLDALKEEFSCEDAILEHFSPPKFDDSLWQFVQAKQGDTSRLKSLYKTQESIFLAIRPLLTVAAKSSKEHRSHILKSIQLLCSANLDLNRYRRLVIAPHLKPDLKRQVLSLPIKHNTFFGDDFAKSTEDIVKKQSTLDKIMSKPKSYQSFRKGGKSFQGKYNKSNYQHSFSKNYSSRASLSNRGGFSYSRGRRGGKYSKSPSSSTKPSDKSE